MSTTDMHVMQCSLFLWQTWDREWLLPDVCVLPGEVVLWRDAAARFPDHAVCRCHLLHDWYSMLHSVDRYFVVLCSFVNCLLSQTRRLCFCIGLFFCPSVSGISQKLLMNSCEISERLLDHGTRNSWLDVGCDWGREPGTSGCLSVYYAKCHFAIIHHASAL